MSDELITTTRYDIAIVGAGPAGLEAAITAVIRGKSVIVFETGTSRLGSEHKIENYLGFPAIAGKALLEKFELHAASLGIHATPDKINEIQDFGEFFSLQGEENLYEARAVILATGTVRAMPIPGETQLLGRGVSYCATCDGRAYRDKSTLVIAFGPGDEMETIFLSKLARFVYFYPQYEQPFVENERPANLEIRAGRPTQIVSTPGKQLTVHFGEEQQTVDGVFIFRPSAPPWRQVSGLEIQGNRVVTDRLGKTNIAGVFAAGDITGAPYQYIKAAGEGNVAALAAVAYIDTLGKLQKL